MDTNLIGIIIRVDGTTEPVAMAQHDALATMQKIVGGYIEGVTIDGGRMYVNEEGLIRGLPKNVKASTFYPGPTPICGDVLIVGPIDQEGYDTSITQPLIERIAALNPRYPVETLDDLDDNGTMPENVAELEKIVVGRRIVSAQKERATFPTKWGHEYTGEGLVLTLDDGTRAILVDESDCCAFTELQEFLLHPESVDHVILGVGTTDEYQTWHVYADMGDVLTMKVGWSAGNPFYYGYGFTIAVIPETV